MWPTDQIIKDRASGKDKLTKKDIIKYVIAFSDEALVLVILIYFAWKAFT